MLQRQMPLEIAARNLYQINNCGRWRVSIPMSLRACCCIIRQFSVRLWDTACPLVNTGHPAQLNHGDLKTQRFAIQRYIKHPENYFNRSITA